MDQEFDRVAKVVAEEKDRVRRNRRAYTRTALQTEFHTGENVLSTIAKKYLGLGDVLALRQAHRTTTRTPASPELFVELEDGEIHWDAPEMPDEWMKPKFFRAWDAPRPNVLPHPPPPRPGQTLRLVLSCKYGMARMPWKFEESVWAPIIQYCSQYKEIHLQVNLVDSNPPRILVKPD